MNKKILIIIITFIAIVGLFIFNLNLDSNYKAEAIEEDISLKTSNEIGKKYKVKVDIKGSVKNPGVYEVDNTSRVYDVIQIAGGLKKDANTNYINLSAKVTDEMVIWIYSDKEIKELKLEQTSTKYMIQECNCPTVDNTTCLNTGQSNGGLININTATIEELSKLSGIGESKAKAIIEYREANGKFKTIEDIKNVTGIGESAYNKIKDYITV